MNQAPSVEKARSRRERIREMGFDPRHLTIEEQEELLDLDWRLEPRGESAAWSDWRQEGREVR